MGMYDSLYDNDGDEWQTKALDQTLGAYRIGDRVPGEAIDYQAPIAGSDPLFRGAYATIRAGVLTALPAPRDTTIPLVDYRGYPPYHPEGDEA